MRNGLTRTNNGEYTQKMSKTLSIDLQKKKKKLIGIGIPSLVRLMSTEVVSTEEKRRKLYYYYQEFTIF